MSEEEKDIYDSSMNIIRRYFYNNLYKNAKMDLRLFLYKDEKNRWVIKYYDSSYKQVCYIPSIYHFETLDEAIVNYVYLLVDIMDDYYNIINEMNSYKLLRRK